MSAYGDTVRATLSQLEDDELIEKIRTGSLTEEAHQVAAEILAQRGANASPVVEPTVVMGHLAPKQTKGSDVAFLSRCFRGSASLNDAFWVLGLGILVGLAAPVLIVSSFLRGSIVGTAIGVLGWVAVIAASIFRDISIWRCAPNAKNPIWGIAARLWIFLSYGLVLVFAVFR